MMTLFLPAIFTRTLIIALVRFASLRCPVIGSYQERLMSQDNVPDTVSSSQEIAFNQEEYEELRRRFLEPRVERNVELPGGQSLRKKTYTALIDRDLPGVKAMKVKIAQLEQSNKHDEIYRLLLQLKEYLIHNRPVPFMQTPNRSDEVNETIDLSNLEDPKIIDVDKYIMDVLLVKTVKADPNAVSEATTQNQNAPSTHKRARVEGDNDNEDIKLPAVSCGDIDTIIQRLDRLELDNKSLRSENEDLKLDVKRLQACTPTVLVEFKFSSLQTALLSNNEWKGVLHVPMVQHPVSGEYTIPSGTTKVQGQAEFAMWRGNKTMTFTGKLERKPGQPVDKFLLGMNLEYELDDTPKASMEPAIKSCKREYDAVYSSDLDRKSEYPYATTNIQEFVSEDQNMIMKWEENAGGILSFYAPASFAFDPEYYEKETGQSADEVVHEAKYKLRIYTVLSTYKPYQTMITPVEDDAKPDWKALYVVMKTRYPGQEYGDIVRAVKQYILFLELKQAHNDYKSEKFSPSVAIDEIWHAHLSFLDRYQRDIQAMTKSNKIFEHNPVLGRDAKMRYQAAREAHVARMTALGEPVDPKFWPNATPPFDEAHDGDSSDELYVPSFASCG